MHLTFVQSVLYCKSKARFTFYAGGVFLNNRIKELRKEHSITQDDLAVSVGVTRQTIISLECGRYNASLSLAHKIAKYFNTSIEDVFIFEEE